MAEKFEAHPLSSLPSTILYSSNSDKTERNLNNSPEDILRLIESASRNLNFHGTIIQQKEQDLFTLEIIRLVEKGKEYEKICALDGAERTVLKRGDKKFIINSDNDAVAIRTVYAVSTFPTLLKSENIPRILNLYQLINIYQPARIVNRKTKIIYLQARDKYRWSYRFWIDDQTNLILKMQILNHNNEVLEQKVFSKIHFGSLPLQMKAQLKESIKITCEKPAKTQKLADSSSKLTGYFPIEVKGFKQRAQWTNNLNDNLKYSASNMINQAFYWDGLSSVSVFIEPDNKVSRQYKKFNLGATQLLVEKWNNNWIIVVGEVPNETLQNFLAAIKSQSL